MVEKYRAKMTPKQRQEAVELYLNSDLGYKEIAEKFNCTIGAIYKLVKKYRDEEQEQKAI